MRMRVADQCSTIVEQKPRNKVDGRDGIAGHVTPSFLTDDKIESQSNFDLQVSLV